MTDLTKQDIEVLDLCAQDLDYNDWKDLVKQKHIFRANCLEQWVVLARQAAERKKHNVCQLCENEKEDGTICLTCFKGKMDEVRQAENKRCLKEIEKQWKKDSEAQKTDWVAKAHKGNTIRELKKRLEAKE